MEQFDEDDPHTSLYIVFQKIDPARLDVEEIIRSATELSQRVKPGELIEEMRQEQVRDLNEEVIRLRADSPFLNHHLTRMHEDNPKFRKKNEARRWHTLSTFEKIKTASSVAL